MESTAYIEKMVESLGQELYEHLARKDYPRAKQTFQTLKSMTNICKMRLLGVMMKASTCGVGIGLSEMERRAAETIKVVMKEEAYTARTGMLARILGKAPGAAKWIAPRALGAVGAVLLVKDLTEGADYFCKSMAERVVLARLAQYGDYLEEYESGRDHCPFKTYKQWYADIYLPGQQKNNSEFWQHMKRLFPQGLPA
jgi:hypothetical protein